MRVLYVADEFPWPPDNGYRMRVRRALDALTAIADVDFFVASDVREPDDRALPLGHRIARWRSVDRAPLTRGARDVPRWVVSSQPRQLLWRDWSAARAALTDFVAPPYDLVWYCQSDLFVALHPIAGLDDTPVVTDINDLESFKARHRLAMRDGASAAARLADRVDARRWARGEKEIARRSTIALVCSDLDRERVGLTNVRVYPNVYDTDAPPAAPVPLTQGPPTALFVGLLTYPPNVDAVHVLADDIWPRVREHVDGAQLRIVGRGDPGVRGPGLQVIGPVEDLSCELQRAHLAPMPIRYGGGTRVKLLEAFAHRIPVVATAVAAEGIAVEDGVHLRIEDEPDAFAQQCVRLLTAEHERRQLTAAAFARWQQRYTGAQASEIVQALARAATS